jgi:hypothetical protein
LATVPLSVPKITRRETMIDSLVVSYAATLAALMLIGAIETTVLIKMCQIHDRVQMIN